MRNLFLSMMAAVAMAAAVDVPAQASTVNFTIKITEVQVEGKGAAVGNEFAGSLSYDDTGLTPGDPFTRSQSDGTLLTLTFPFLDRTVTEEGSEGEPPFELYAEFDDKGSLTGLFFSVDVPGAFFLSSVGLLFDYDYSAKDGDEEVLVASGKGVLIPEETPVAVPLPATAPLLLSAFVVAAAVRRRKTVRR